MKKILLFFLLFNLGFGALSQDTKITVLLPIHWTETKNYNLVVSIPADFRSIQNQSDWLEEKTNILEFIPEGEADNAWSEIITLNKFIGEKISAKALSKRIKRSMLTQVQNGKVWQNETDTSQQDYITTKLGISYDLGDFHEVFSARFYSGPYDCVGVQYTIRAKDNQNDEALKKKIENFFQNNVKIVHSNPG